MNFCPLSWAYSIYFITFHVCSLGRDDLSRIRLWVLGPRSLPKNVHNSCPINNSFMNLKKFLRVKTLCRDYDAKISAYGQGHYKRLLHLITQAILQWFKKKLRRNVHQVVISYYAQEFPSQGRYLQIFISPLNNSQILCSIFTR